MCVCCGSKFGDFQDPTVCEHDWEWRVDLNNQLYGICKKCKEVNEDYRSPEINI
jgi:hypothetical protein